MALSETPFCLRRWPLSGAHPAVRSPFHAVFDVPLARCAGVGAHRSPAPDRRPQALCQKTAKADCRRPSVLGFPVPGLVRLALSDGHRQTRDRDRLASQGISPWKIRHGRVGRPAVSCEVRDLIRRMSRENRLWGAPHIHGELLKLGIEISETSVAKYVVRHRKPPSQTWRTFLGNHVQNLVSVDFFTVPTIRFQVLYVFLVLAHDRRRVVHFNVTVHPTAEWTAQQLREAFPFDQIPRYLLRSVSARGQNQVASRTQDAMDFVHHVHGIVL